RASGAPCSRTSSTTSRSASFTGSTPGGRCTPASRARRPARRSRRSGSGRRRDRSALSALAQQDAGLGDQPPVGFLEPGAVLVGLFVHELAQAGLDRLLGAAEAGTQ